MNCLKKAPSFLSLSIPSTTSLNRVNEEKYREVSKGGQVNHGTTRVAQQSKRFLSDIFTTYLELEWVYTILFFIFSFVGSWIIFALLWYAIVHLHDDFANIHIAHWKPCVSNIKNFASAFLFSVETQHTIGYGHRVISEECPEAVTLFCFQSIFGTILQGGMVGLLFVKMVSSKKRGETLLFSSIATITIEDGVKKQFMFRIGDLRRSHILDARVRAFVIWKNESGGGALLQKDIHELRVEGEGERGRGEILLFWPTTIVHEINDLSPLKKLKHTTTQFEIIVILQGISESSGMMTQARSSYLPDEIIWGHKLKALDMTHTGNGYRLIDFNNFHATEPCTD